MLASLSEELKHSRAFEQDMRKFADIITSTPDLQEKLTAAVDGGISRDGFRDFYVSCASEHGIHFTAEQMEIAMQEQKQGKDKVLPSMVQKLISIL